MMSYLKHLSLITIILILSACGGEEPSTGEINGNPPNDVTNPTPGEPNIPPEISGVPATTATVGMFYSFTPGASDSDGDSLSFTASSLPAWVTLDSASGTISGTPDSNDVGLTGEIVLTVSDGNAQTSLAPFTISVSDDPDLQVLNLRVATGMDDVEERADGSIYVDSGDLELINDGADQVVGLRFAVTIPQHAVIKQAHLRFTADEASANEANLVIWAEASDDAAAFTTSNGNVSGRPSTLASATWSPSAWSSVGESAEAQTSSDISSVIQEVVARGGWRSNNHLALVITGSGVRTADSYEGGAANAALLTIGYTVDVGNRAPTISGVPDAGATVGYGYSFTPVAVDPDGDSLSFSVANKPAWASFDVQTGTLAGTPAAGDIGGQSDISISVSDGEFSATLGSFSIQVSANNHPPVISGTPVSSVVEQSHYSFTPTATDSDGDSLSFSITNGPSWAVFDPATGNLSGTPGYNDAGTYGNIVISVSDGSVSASLTPFAITVADLNRSPVISGTPSTSVAEGDSYSFTPSASDADGNNLVFSVNNAPAWATFNTGTGQLSGTPDFSSAGSYNNIAISVSDGVASVSLAPFSISVTDVNRAPVISGSPSLGVTAGNAYNFVPNADDADGDNLSFSVTNLPSWASFDNATGSLTGTPQEADVGDHADVQISVTDGTEVVALSAFTISVQTATTPTGDIALSWVAPSTRTDGANLDLSEIGGYVVHLGTSSNNLQSWVDINDNTTTTHTINNLAYGTYYIAITSYDTDGNTSSFSNIVTVVVN